MAGSREDISVGVLVAYGANRTDLTRRAAGYVDKILKGTKPADLPFEQPIKFDLVVNLVTAKGIGLRIPEAFLMRADEVIE
jgi:putative ABC transport system substrate-binding protein